MPDTDPNAENVAPARSARSRSRATDRASHFGDDLLREIANKLRDLRTREQTIDGELQGWKLQKAEVALAYGALYINAKARCKEIGRPVGKWIKQVNLHEWRMAEYLMQAVRLGVNSQRVANLGVVNAINEARGRTPSEASERLQARRTANARRLAELQSPEAIAIIIEGYDFAEFDEAARHRRRPHPRIQRPGHGIEHLMIDSGAWSVYRVGAEVDLKEYCAFAHSIRDLAPNVTIVNLDVIDPDEPQESASASYENFQYMRSRGLNPMPVYHVGEHIDWLKRYLDAGCTYIGLAALSSPSDEAEFHAQAWELLSDSAGKPLVRVHALGVGRAPVLLAYPWASADASSWVSEHRFRGGYTPLERAESIYRPARIDARLQWEVQDARPTVPFHFHLVMGASSWGLPTLAAVRHRSALYSYVDLKQPATLNQVRAFIADPQSLLTNDTYRTHSALLEKVAERYRTT